MTINKIILIAREIVSMLSPRFRSERVAMATHKDGSLQVLCVEGQEISGDDEYIVCYGTCSGFNLFGFMCFNKVVLDEE